MSVKSSAVEDKVCPNHPERGAVTRCLTCMKPICSECVVAVEGEDFCSKDCANNHFITSKGVEELNARLAARRRRAFLRKVFLLVLLLLIVGGAWYAWNRVLTPKQKTEWMEKIGLDKHIKAPAVNGETPGGEN